MRINVDEIHRVWRNASIGRIKNVLKLTERAVLQPNEDTITLATGAADNALVNIDKKSIGAVFLGTGTNPYDTRPSVTLVSEALGLNYAVFSGDVQFAGKSGSTAMQICTAMIESGMANSALAIGADTINRHSCPGRAAEYSGSAAGAAFVLSREGVIAELKATASYASDLSDAFRVEGERYISDIGDGGKIYPAFEIGMLEHISKAVEAVFAKAGITAADCDYAIFQQPHGGIAAEVGGRLGFVAKQLEPGNIACRIGDCGAASALLAFANVLDSAKAGQKILLATYGNGAGSDALLFETTELIEQRQLFDTVQRQLANKQVVDYARAARYEYKYAQDDSPLYI